MYSLIGTLRINLIHTYSLIGTLRIRLIHICIPWSGLYVSVWFIRIPWSGLHVLVWFIRIPWSGLYVFPDLDTTRSSCSAPWLGHWAYTREHAHTVHPQSPRVCFDRFLVTTPSSSRGCPEFIIIGGNVGSVAPHHPARFATLQPPTRHQIRRQISSLGCRTCSFFPSFFLPFSFCCTSVENWEHSLV